MRGNNVPPGCWFPPAHIAELEIGVVDFVETGVCFCDRNRFRIDINTSHASRAEAFRRENKNPAPRSKIGKRPTFFPFASQAFEETKRHCRRCMFSCPESGGSWNDEEPRVLDPRSSVRCPQRMWSGTASVDPLKTADATAL